MPTIAATKDSPYFDLNLDCSSEDTKASNVLTGKLDLFLQELEIALQSGSEDIYGHPSSINLIDYVFKRFITKQQVINDIKTYVENNCAHARFFSWNVDCDADGYRNERILLIKFSIEKGDETYTVNFKIEK